MKPYRILVTGARDWPDDPADLVTQFVTHTLSIVVANCISPNWPVLIVHGACPYGGVDAIADRFVRSSEYHRPSGAGWRWLDVEPHPADWATHGKAAGPIRNGHMVALGADICLAFPTEGSRGTVDCLNKAIAAGIHTRVFPIADARRRCAAGFPWRSL